VVHPEIARKGKKERGMVKTNSNTHVDSNPHLPPMTMPLLQIPTKEELEPGLEPTKSSSTSLLSPRTLLSPRAWREKKEKRRHTQHANDNGSCENSSQQEEKEVLSLRFYLIGEPGVGKSSLINRYFSRSVILPLFFSGLNVRFVHGEWNPATITAWNEKSDSQTFEKTLTIGQCEVWTFSPSFFSRLTLR
jgi:hypothetical protein